MPLSPYKTILIYKSPIPFYTIVGAVQYDALAGRYDKLTNVIYLSMRSDAYETVNEILLKIGVTRHHMAVFNSVGDSIGKDMHIKELVKTVDSDDKPPHLTEVRH